MGSSIPSISLANLTAISFIFLTHCAALHSAQNESSVHCPVFNCGNLTNITYPFTDLTNPICGLGIISCVNGSIPMIEFQDKKAFFKVNCIFYNNQTVVIADQQFTNIIQESIDCRSLYNFSGNLVSSSLSFQLMSPTLTLFNCNRNTYFNPLLFDDFYGYGGCSNYDIFFYGNSNQSLCRPIGCQVFQFPVHGELLSFDGDNYWGDNLPSLLAKGFSLRWSFPSLCNDCTRKGNRCLKKTNGSFTCVGLDDGGDFVTGLNETRSNRTPKIAAIGFNETRSNRTPKIVVIVVPIVVIGTIVTSIILFCCKRRKFSPVNLVLFWKRRTKTSKNLEDFLKNCASLAPKRYSYSDIKKMTDSFKDKLGQGGFGGVYKGKLHDNGGFVAVKVLNESKGNGEDFINEVASISRTSHVNIVSLLGFCLDGPNRALIYEFMPNGSLEKFIYNENQLRGHPQLGWERLHRIAVGIARGLEYLHRGCNTRILHFDIKPHNILLDEDFCPKIADFGLAKLCLKKESIVSMAGARGTAGYIAPEVFYRSFGGVSHKSDVYSYGMMILEMVGGRKNIDAEADHVSEIYFPHWIHRRLELDESLGLHVTTAEEEELARKMILVGLWCIQTHPTNRPSISKVLEMLEGSVESLQIPPKPFLSSPPRSPAGSSPESIS